MRPQNSGSSCRYMPGAAVSVLCVQFPEQVQCSGTKTLSTRTLFDPLEFIPMMLPLPQSGITVTFSIGVQMVRGPCSSRPGASVVHMKWVACPTPDQYSHCPLTTYPPSTGVAVPIGAARCGQVNR